MDHGFTYDLGFESPKRRPRTEPEIVFSISKQNLDEAIDRLHKLSAQFFGYANSYLGADVAAFSLPVPDLFGNKEFGYRNCSYWTVEEGRVHFRLPLRPAPWTQYCTLTVFLLTRAFDVPFNDEVKSNRKQMLSLTTIAETRNAGWGHAVGGWLSQDVMRWLKDYAKAYIQKHGINRNMVPMHPLVINAEKAAAHAMIQSHEDAFKASSSCVYGFVRDNGAFALNCFGDACDLGVYPDQWLDETCPAVQFGCHNLDTAEQQLTLLAGLAKICQLARESSEDMSPSS